MTETVTKPSPAHGTTTAYRHGCRCAACSEAVAKYNRHRHAANPQLSTEYKRHWRAKNAKKAADYQRHWREEHPGYWRKWEATHPGEAEAHAARQRGRIARKLGNGGSHTAVDVKVQHKRQHGRCFWCEAKTGATYHVDHVIPLCKGGSNGPENIVVACSHCNLSKGAKHPMDFAGMLC